MTEAAVDKPKPPSPPPASPPQRRRARFWRWIRRLTLAALLVLVLAIGGGQILLWTDLPRRIVVQQVQRQLGLRIEARSLSTGWFGQTTLRDVSASLPLADEAFLNMPIMRVGHTSLVSMIFGQSLRIERIELQRPTLTLQQNAAGRWNLLEAVELMARAGGRGPAEADPRPPQIPRLTIDNATFDIVNRDGRRAQLAPVSVTGRPDGPLVYRYDLRSPQQLTITGELVPGRTWQHEAQLDVQAIEVLAVPFGVAWDEPTNLQARWRGQAVNGGVRGRLQVESLKVGETAAHGIVHASYLNGVWTARPQELLVRPAPPGVPDVMLTSGAISLQGDRIRAEELRVGAAGGAAELRGQYDWAARTGEISLTWREIGIPAGVRQSGQLQAALETAFPERPKFSATLTSTGQLEDLTQWTTQMRMVGSGESFASIDWQAHFDRALLDWRRNVNLSGLALHGRVRGSVLSIDDIALPQRGRLTGAGAMNLDTNQWWLWLSGGDLSLPRADQPALALDFNAWGDLTKVDVNNVYLSVGDLQVWASGFYDSERPQPVNLEVHLAHLPELGSETSDIIRGRLRAEAELVGTVRPLLLQVDGWLIGKDLFIRERALGDPRGRVEGTITLQAAEVRTTRLRLLDGEWDVSAIWPTDPGRAVEVDIGVTGLPLNEVAEAFHLPALAGAATARATLSIPEPRLEQLVADGTFEINALSLSPLEADRVIGTLALRDRKLYIEPIQFSHHDGSILASARTELTQPTRWNVEAEVTRWPIELPEGQGALQVQGQLDVFTDVAGQTVSGTAGAVIDFRRDGRDFGTGTIELTADRRVLRARRLHLTLLDGELTGEATFRWDQPMRSTAHIEWRGLDLGQLSTWFVQLEGVAGKSDGSFVVAPATDPRALGPLEINLALSAPEGRYRTLDLRTLQLRGFADLAGADSDETADRWRLVAPEISMQIADGQVDAFARLTMRNNDVLSAQATFDFTALDLDRIVHAVDPEAEPMPGRLAGSATLAGDPRDFRLVFGDATISLTESDLANFDPVGVLYNLMRVGGAPRGPAGIGNIQLRVENESLLVEHLYLFNRGVEVRGVGAVEDLFQLPHSPIDATLVGTARPLRDLRLPFMADVDQVFAALQTQATTVRVTGTVKEPDVRTTTLDEVGDALRALLIGDVQRESRRR